MEATRLAPTAGIVVCALVLAALAVPYAIVDASAVGTYYGTGLINPLFTGVVALVCVIVFASGGAERTDPVVAAAVTIAFGAFGALAALAWAATVPLDVVFGLSGRTVLEHHRWAVAALSLGVPVSGGWFARTLGVV